jgi:hypothetical protein
VGFWWDTMCALRVLFYFALDSCHFNFAMAASAVFFRFAAFEAVGCEGFAKLSKQECHLCAHFCRGDARSWLDESEFGRRRRVGGQDAEHRRCV